MMMIKFLKKNLFYILILNSLAISTSYAFTWSDLWQRPDQQGAKALAADKSEEAAVLFQDPAWQGIANYRAKKFADAEKDFAKLDNTHGNYNRGNALAQQGKYEQAIAAYDRAINQDSRNRDAIDNREVVKKLLKQKQQQHTQNQKNQNQNQQKNKQQAKNQENKQNQQQAQKNNKKQSKKSKQSKEQTQATKQWLGSIDDDPGGLLRQKFIRDHQRYQANMQQGKEPW